MANAKLDFNEEQLDKNSDLFQLYDRLYKGMVKANEVDPPELPSSTDLIVVDSNGQPIFDEKGEPVINLDKKAEVEAISENYATILRKNSAYLFANSILSVMNGGGSSGDSSTVGFVSRAGDTMKGALSAWYGFDAGVNGTKIFEVTINAEEQKAVCVYGDLKVTENIHCSGIANLEGGIAFSGNKVIYFDNSALCIENHQISVNGQVSIKGAISLGAITIQENGVFYDKYEYYHANNSNKLDVNWNMCDAIVNKDITVGGNADVSGKILSKNGFDFEVNKFKLLHSEVVENIGEDGEVVNVARTVMGADLRIVNGFGIKFGDDYIAHVRNSKVVSFSAPGMILNLGDSDNGHQTEKISLQSDVYEYSNSYKVITKEGAGNFVNGIRAQCAINGSTVLESFRLDADNLGVLFKKQIRFGSVEGSSVFYDEEFNQLKIQLPYVNGGVADMPVERMNVGLLFQKTTSPFSNKSLDWSSTLHFTTDGEFFAFDKPIESDYFAIKSEKYHTRLIEDALFFDDGKFIEGVVDGLRYSGNGYFDGNISSQSFASGFAGYGWAVKNDVTNGGFHATYDSLTVRKKMRVYELEVQKIYSTNGSLWVSDNCSGDEVIAL